MTLREFALDIVRRLRARGHTALWAGGCVRDQLLGLEPHDYDVATDATPSAVQKIFRRSLAVGAQFGVIEVLGPLPKMHVQVATFRTDLDYRDGRHPSDIRFGTAEEDAQRRDFTINGLFFDPVQEKVIDYVGGQQDLQAKCLRAIGNPEQRFEEDKLRLLRAARFVARFGLTLEPETLSALTRLAPKVIQVSPERITDELRKMTALSSRATAFQLLVQTGLLAQVFGPWAAPTNSLEFPVLNALAEPVPFPLAIADILLELHGSLLDELLARKPVLDLALHLRISNEEREHLAWLLKERDVLRRASRLSYSVLKPLLAHVWIDDLLAWLRARLEAQGHSTDAVEFCRAKRVSWAPRELDPLPLLTGDDLIRLGFQPGPEFKGWLAAIRAAQLDEEIHTPQEAAKLLKLLVQETKKEA